MDGDVRGYDRLKDTVKRTDFNHDIKAIQQSYDKDHTAATYTLIAKYNLLQIHYPIIEALVDGLSVNEAVMVQPEPVAQIVNHERRTIEPNDDPHEVYEVAEAVDGFRTGITIQLNSDASREEIIDFIEKNYKTHIKPFLAKYKRLSDRYYPSRDEEIKNDKQNGLSVQEIADKHNISVPRVYQILKQKL